ncbi:strawberry notch C-terminal domain-containing protein [Paracoccus sp. ME4]|uniref:strawberry notch C-terminal domain-containing protein n=1 Tax=Paracoccus sp. ME4 TaxID=3138066 RepID=UPI00398A8476
MSEQKTPAATKDIVAWVGFAENSAILRRVLIPGGGKGLLLRTAEGEGGESVREKAMRFGFSELKTRGTLRMLFSDGQIPFGAKLLAKELGGKLIPVERADLMSEKWTINLSAKSPVAVATRGKSGAPQPDPGRIRQVGLNMRGEEVVSDDNGRYLRRVDEGTGKSRFIHESEGDRPTLFLRATRREDLEGIASGLVAMAGRGTLHHADLLRVIEAACEAGPHGRVEIHQADALDLVREHMLREISAVGVEGDASRDRFIGALRLANSTGVALSRRTDAPGGLLSPSPAMIAFMRRAVRGQSAVSFRGSDDMRISMPRLHREDAALQFHDLGGISPDGMGGYVANAISRRPENGRTILRFPMSGDDPTFQAIRGELGLNYALEVVAEISPAVADGVQDGEGSTVMIIGERRPEPLEALPMAALRTFQVLTTDDLLNLEREITRARAKIREFHDGVETAAEADDAREENARQKPYLPLSRVKEPFTMIPLALEGATAKALNRMRRDFDEHGGVDAVVGAALGQSIDSLGDILTSEQVDAVAMQINAADRGRGFLLADQTGVGKGRSLAAMARAHIRANAANRVLYFTESGQINVPDVCRDLKDVGAWGEIRVLFMAPGAQLTDITIDATTGEEVHREMVSPSASARRAIFETGVWPEEYNVVITTYSQFRGTEDAPSSVWLANAPDENTLVILDEAHNALNPKSRQGRAVRTAIEAVGAGNVIFGTATPSRDPSGMNLYKPLLPQDGAVPIDELLDNMSAGGEVAQEAFATMLAEDGVMLRRDHDLSNIDFKVALPDDAKMLEYQGIMDQFSPVVELMIEASGVVSEHLGRVQAQAYQQMVRNGMSREAARAQTNELNQYSNALGSPLANLARITMNALKIDQTVDAALQEIAEGRKPLITFHSTNGGLLQELARGDENTPPEEAMAAATNLTLRDQIHRIHEGMYRIRIDGETSDARVAYPAVAEAAALITQQIDRLPENLPVSPVDALIERLEQNGVSVGEISGRTLCYRDNRIQRRQDRNRRDTINEFNAGGLDCIIYNSAGATGGSMHASPNFADQRPRSMIELEAPVDVIKYVQSQGRGNRYGQVANPRVISVVTGLIPEMRILQQRNRKLRSLGASVDGNRSHPLLLDDVPDLLNRVGDEATRNVLMSMPALSRRLGFPEFAEDPSNNRREGNEAVDTGSGVRADTESLANRVLARSIMLVAREQDDLVQRIRMEFDALIEELESRNANPLRPKQLEGQIEIRATSLYSGREMDDADLDTSAFMSPLYLSTGIHHFNEEAWTGDKLVSEVEACRRLYGADGFTSWAERISQNMPMLMRPFLPEGVSMEDALERPEEAGNKFRVRHTRLTDLAWLLENMRPGVSIRFPSEMDPDGLTNRTIVGLTPPTNPLFYELGSAYKIKVISPGMARPETVSLSRIGGVDMERIRFRPGISETFEEGYLEEFDRDRLLTRRAPVQILHGSETGSNNILQALTEAARHDLGTISLFRDMENHVHRGIVVHRAKVNMESLPANISNGEIAAEFAHRFLHNAELVRTQGLVKMWGGITPGKAVGNRQDADVIVTMTERSFRLDMLPVRKSTWEFYSERPGLHEAMYQRPLCRFEDAPARAYRRPGKKGDHLVELDLTTREGLRRTLDILELLDTPLLTDGRYRTMINEVVNAVADDEIDRDARIANPDDQEAPEMEGADVPEGDGDAPTPQEEPADNEDLNNMHWG